VAIENGGFNNVGKRFLGKPPDATSTELSLWKV
jgi:hypothetical protein